MNRPVQASAQGPHQVHLHIDRLHLPPGTALPPGGLAGLEAAIGEALGLALQAPPSGAVDAVARPPATLAQAIAEQLRPQLQPQLQPPLAPPQAPQPAPHRQQHQRPSLAGQHPAGGRP